jgi:hypothetical protein
VVDSSLYKTYIKRTAFTPRYQRVVLAKAVLHELGHSLGLSPWAFYGIDNMPGGNVRWPESLSQEDYEQINVKYKSIMNYNYIFPMFRDRNFFDYSNGENGENYDFDDWAHVYLPSFQTDTDAVEEPNDETFEDFEKIDKSPEPVYKNWIYGENLTLEYFDKIVQYDMVKNADCQFRIYIKEEDKNLQNELIDIRLYVKPNVEPVVTRWSLIKEGKLNTKENSLEFYSFYNLYDELMSMI